MLSLPADLEIEKLLLGNCFLRESLDPVAHLDESAFFSEQHKKIFRALTHLAENNVPINYIEVTRFLAANNNGVPASYVTSLTDGIPVLANFEHYHNRLRELAQQRAALSDAWNLSNALEHGETSAEIVERATAIADKYKPAPEAEAPKPKLKYPELPETAWYGITKLYRSAVEHTSEASNNYHLASFYAAFSALLGKSIYTRMRQRLYPSLYVVFVGPSGSARKGTAIDYTIDLATEIDPNIYIVDQIDSKESFIREIAEAQRTSEDSASQRSIRLVLRLTEFRELLEKAEQKGVRNMIPFLCKIYDCPGWVEIKTGVAAKCKEPFMVIAAATSPSYLDTLTPKDIEGGFANRLIIVPGDPKARISKPPDKDAAGYNNLKGVLKDIVTEFRLRAGHAPSGSIEIPMSEAADKMMDRWYRHEFNPPTDDEMIAVLSERDHVTCHQIAMLNAAMEFGDADYREQIQERHLESAIQFVNFLYEARYPIFASHGLTPMAKIDAKIIEYVKLQPKRSVMWKVLRNAMRRACPDHEIFKRRMAAITDGTDGALRIEPLGKKRWVVYND